jgi:hypothetical protein
MTEITIVVSPAFDNRGKRRHDRFDARLQSSDEVICEVTRQPLIDASRELLRRGADPNATICKVSASEPAVVTLRARIGVAAQYEVMGEKFVRRKRAAGPMPGTGIENGGWAEPTLPCNNVVNVGAPHKGSTRTATTSSPTSSPAASPTSSPTSRYRLKEK